MTSEVTPVQWEPVVPGSPLTEPARGPLLAASLLGPLLLCRSQAKTREDHMPGPWLGSMAMVATLVGLAPAPSPLSPGLSSGPSSQRDSGSFWHQSATYWLQMDLQSRNSPTSQTRNEIGEDPSWSQRPWPLSTMDQPGGCDPSSLSTQSSIPTPEWKRRDCVKGA
ncbi:hypothetical protein CB1_000465023 [Camelus ferus]|nr:hypothetical protein CB1_000465023 [Camelus ferus]